MKQVAKLIIIDPENHYLLMYRNNHPMFGNDPDLPGGTLETGETVLETMIREVKEEVGVDIDGNRAREMYSGAEYSTHGTHYSLFEVNVDERPEITISWEHADYAWLTKSMFLEKIKNSQDTYMHMVYDTLNKR